MSIGRVPVGLRPMTLTPEAVEQLERILAEPSKCKIIPQQMPELKEMTNLEEKVEALEEVLRRLASFVGNGGYNADEVDPAIFEEKIRDGIDYLIKSITNHPISTTIIGDRIRLKLAKNEVPDMSDLKMWWLWTSGEDLR